MMLSARFDRRAFLRGATGAAGLFALDRAGLVTGCSNEVFIEDQVLERLLPGKVLRPGAAEYEALTTPWNLHWAGKRPKARAIVRAESTEDVALAIRWARDNGVPLTPRSGGHSYAGYSTTSGVLLDVSKMRAVNFDEASREVTVGGGARNIDLYRALPKYGATVTHGRCKEVGVAGLILGGGIGFNMRRIGLTCDQLVSTVMVTADGEVRTCSATENQDLFWAARGAGGGNFGVHTSFRLRTFEAPKIVAFNLVWESQLEAVVRALCDLFLAAPRELGVKLSVSAAPNPGGAPKLSVSVLGQYAGPRAEFDKLMAPIFAIAQPAQSSKSFLQEGGYWDGQELLSDAGPPELVLERSHYCIEAVSNEGIAFVFEQLRAWPQTSVGVSWKGFVTGGKVQDVRPADTAFVHRKDWMLSTIELDWAPADEPSQVARSHAWLDRFHDGMVRFTSNESYQNFIDDAQSGWPRAYHGQNLERLSTIKRTYDKNNFFRFAQSVPVSLTRP
jgi:FAD/FMN-containing dehydrogenase